MKDQKPEPKQEEVEIDRISSSDKERKQLSLRERDGISSKTPLKATIGDLLKAKYAKRR